MNRWTFLVMGALVLGACGSPAPEPIGTSASALTMNVIATHGSPYLGGPVLTGTVDVYLIWYGAVGFAQGYTPSMQHFVGGISHVEGRYQPWDAVTTYYDINGNRASNNLVYSGQYIDTTFEAGHGPALSTAAILDNAVTHGLPDDPNGLYMIVADGTVVPDSGCGHHESDFDGTRIVPDGIVFTYGGCNVVFSEIFHEMAEAVTDPFNSSAWHCNGGTDGFHCTNSPCGAANTTEMQGDACECQGAYQSVKVWPYTKATDPSYQVQPLWVNKGAGYCAWTPYQPGDINGDGVSDIAIVGGSDWSTLPIGFSNASGGWTITNLNDCGAGGQCDIPYFESLATEPGTHAVSGDFNGDGLGDIALVGKDWNGVPIAFSASPVTGTGSSPFAPRGVFPPASSTGTFNVGAFTTNVSWWNQVDQVGTPVAGDFNGDGYWDIALIGGSGWQSIPVALSNGTSQFNVDNYTTADAKSFESYARRCPSRC